MEILHSFGNYSIRYYPIQPDGAKGGKNHFVIPETELENSLGQTIHVIHGARPFTRQIWAEMCRSLKDGKRWYKGIPLEKAALIYGGELKCPGRAMQSDGTWFERSEAAFQYNTVDGGTICEQFSGASDIIMVWDPEPQPEPIVTADEPVNPPSVSSLGIPSEEELSQELEPLPDKSLREAIEEMESIRAENEQLKAELAAQNQKKKKLGPKPKEPKLNAKSE